MKKSSFFNRKLAIISAMVMMLMMVTTAVHAIVITIDGTREAAWDGGGSTTDANEAGITNNGVDLVGVEWTNGPTNFYFLFQTASATQWDLPGFTETDLLICINNDNNLGTGSSLPGQCVGSGYDRYIAVTGGPVLGVTVYNATFAVIPASTNIATSGIYTELSVDLVSLGLNSGNCLSTMPVGIYMDGQTADPDDNVEDAGDIMMGCGAPTAVSLQNVSANSADTVPTVGIIAFALLAIIGTGVALTRRQQA